MQNSDQIKEAPKPSMPDREILRNLRDATVAVLDLKPMSRGLYEAVSTMVEELDTNKEIDATVDGVLGFDGAYAHRVLSRVFDLDGEEDRETSGRETQAAREAAELAEDEALEAAERLADAFATIEEYRDCIPTRIYNVMSDFIQELRDSSWSSKPDVVRKALPHILRATIEREMGDRKAA